MSDHKTVEEIAREISSALFMSRDGYSQADNIKIIAKALALERSRAEKAERECGELRKELAIHQVYHVDSRELAELRLERDTLLEKLKGREVALRKINEVFYYRLLSHPEWAIELKSMVEKPSPL